jgi:molybdate transport system regulatory protein
MAISARNRLRGTISRLQYDGLMAEVVLRIGDQELVSVITRSSADRLGLELGDEVFAVVKATEVILGKEGREA